MRPPLRSAAATLALWLPLAATAGQEAGVRIELDRTALTVRPLKIREPGVPVIHNASPLRTEGPNGADRFNVVEISRQTAGTEHFPLICSDLVSNFYLRSTYQTPAGPGAHMGTSVIGSPCFRTPESVQFLPTSIGAALRTGAGPRITCEIWGQFRAPAQVLSIRSYPAPAVGRTETGLSVRFRAQDAIRLDHSQRGRDTFRLLTVSSMFTDQHRYDANVLRYEDPKGGVHSIRLADGTPRGAYLSGLDDVVLGGWFELVKEPGSCWYPDSPTIRVEIADRSGVPGRLGLRAFLTDTKPGKRDPNDDSLSVWVEWLDAPEVVAAETSLRLDARIIATPPASSPGP